MYVYLKQRCESAQKLILPARGFPAFCISDRMDMRKRSRATDSWERKVFKTSLPQRLE